MVEVVTSAVQKAEAEIATIKVDKARLETALKGVRKALKQAEARLQEARAEEALLDDLFGPAAAPVEDPFAELVQFDEGFDPAAPTDSVDHVDVDDLFAPVAPEGEPPTVERSEVPTWRRMLITDTGWPDEWDDETCVAISGVATTAGELADELLAGERFGLDAHQLNNVYAALEMISESDERPLRFTAEGKPAGECPVPVGAVVRTSYGTGPYIVRRTDRDESTGLWSLAMAEVSPSAKPLKGESFHLNDVQRQPDGRITSREGADEIHIVPPGEEPGPSYFEWLRAAGLVPENQRPELQRAWMLGEKEYQWVAVADASEPDKAPEQPPSSSNRPSAKSQLKAAREAAAASGSDTVRIVIKPPKKPKAAAPEVIELTTWDGCPGFPVKAAEQLATKGVNTVADLDAFVAKLKLGGFEGPHGPVRPHPQANRYTALKELWVPGEVVFKAGDALVDWEDAKKAPAVVEEKPKGKKRKAGGK